MAGKKKKSTKKETLKKVEEVQEVKRSFWSVFFVIIGILCFFLAFYLLTLFITNKNAPKEEKKDEETETSISSDTILLGKSLSMGEGEYLVIYYDKSDELIANVYDSLVSTYQIRAQHGPLYIVDMSSGFNKSFETDGESNKNPETIQDFAIHGPTLIQVNENKVVDYIEGKEAISNYLK